MKKKRINMDKIREILRMHVELGLGVRKIADALFVSKTAVSDYCFLQMKNTPHFTRKVPHFS